MTILDLQRRLREVGRVRIGQQVVSQNGKRRPSKLDTFRLTSRDPRVIEAAASEWGGDVAPWDDAPDGRQWQVVTSAVDLPCLVPPSDMAFSQSYEQWTAGGCRVRCDSRWDSVRDSACHCDPTNRECDIHTRLSVMLPDLPGVGVWRLDTQGYYAAVELGGVVELCLAQAGRGVMLPARLRLEQRSVKRPGRDGKPETRRFAVPVLDVEMNLRDLMSGQGIGPASTPTLPPSTPQLTPVPPQPADVFRRPVAEQVAEIDGAISRAGSRTTPPPPTGLMPRTAAQVAAKAEPERLDTAPLILEMRTALNALGKPGRAAFLDRYGCTPVDLPTDQVHEAAAYVEQLLATAPPARADGDKASGPGVPPTPGPGVAHAPQEELPLAPDPHPPVVDVARKAAAVFAAEYEAAPRGRKTRTVDRLRHALTYATTGKASLNDLDAAELGRVWQRLGDVASGRMTYQADDEAVTFTMRGHEADGGVRVEWTQVEGDT